MMVFMSLVLVLIGQFCHDVIGHQKSESCSDWSVVVAVIFYLSIVCWFCLRSCMSCL